MNKYVLLIIYWMGYYALHSLLASGFIKNRIRFLRQYYRLVYNIIAIIGFIVLLLYTAVIPPEWLFARNSITKFFGLMPTTYGILIIRHAFKSYSTKDFIGTAQLEVSYKQETFVSSGMLRHVRHPLYLGAILIIGGFFIFSPSISNLIVMVISISYIFIGIYLEEKKLLKNYGMQYEEFKKQVPMIIPKSIKIFHSNK